MLIKIPNDSLLYQKLSELVQQTAPSAPYIEEETEIAVYEDDNYGNLQPETGRQEIGQSDDLDTMIAQCVSNADLDGLKALKAVYSDNESLEKINIAMVLLTSEQEHMMRNIGSQRSNSGIMNFVRNHRTVLGTSTLLGLGLLSLCLLKK